MQRMRITRCDTVLNGGNFVSRRAQVLDKPGSSSDYMTAQEAAKYLRVNHRTLLMWARKQQVPAIPLGGAHRKTWLFSKVTLDEHLRSIMTGNSRPRS